MSYLMRLRFVSLSWVSGKGVSIPIHGLVIVIMIIFVQIVSADASGRRHDGEIRFPFFRSPLSVSISQLVR